MPSLYESHEAYILLVDDEPHNLFLLEELLDIEGYRTESISDGESAIAYAEAHPPELIVLDVMMPGLDGFDVCARLRQIPRLQTVPIIFLTALDDDASRLQGLEAMGDDYLTKPIQTKLFLTKLRNSIQLSRLRQQAQTDTLQTQIQALRQASKRQMDAAWQINEALSEKFRLFVPEKFLQRIAPAGVESIQLGNATEVELTVLFCDIRSFTSIAATQSATETFAWLNEFFTAISQAIDHHQGYIDKYLGDAVMAIFDQPETHVEDGLKAAIAILAAVENFNQMSPSAKLAHPVNVGIGLHTGLGVIGTLGSDQRMDPTVIGDVVNAASRLEELTKTYGYPIVVSDAIVQSLGTENQYDLHWLDNVVLRGRQVATDIYALGDRHIPGSQPYYNAPDRADSSIHNASWQNPVSPPSNLPPSNDSSGFTQAIASTSLDAANPYAV